MMQDRILIRASSNAVTVRNTTRRQPPAATGIKKAAVIKSIPKEPKSCTMKAPQRQRSLERTPLQIAIPIDKAAKHTMQLDKS